MPTEYQICTRCVMDTTDPDIRFDDFGVCNHCIRYEQLSTLRLFDRDDQKQELTDLVAKIKLAGAGKKYDCVIGVSGGVDSTYVAYLVHKLGLRPLAVHLDNGWDSELAVKNIEKTLTVLGIDLYTYVIDWKEFRDLQLSFLRASTPDSEIPTDHAIVAILYRIAAKQGVRYLINGTNIVTESILPTRWSYGHSDLRYIRNVHSTFGSRPLKTFPKYNLLQWCYFTYFKKIEWLPILNYVPYNKAQAMATIQERLGWVYYGGKHYESVYTRFFQAYILPRKFNIDKRRAHYSNLVCSGQMSREQALFDLTLPIGSPEMLTADRDYVIKKLGLDEAEFEKIMAFPPKSFMQYQNQYEFVGRLKRLRSFLGFFRRPRGQRPLSSAVIASSDNTHV